MLRKFERNTIFGPICSFLRNLPLEIRHRLKASFYIINPILSYGIWKEISMNVSAGDKNV
jgi:hypothetical protein